MALHPRQSAFTLFFNKNQLTFPVSGKAVFGFTLPTAINLPFRENWSMAINSISLGREFLNFDGGKLLFLYKTPTEDWRGALLKNFTAHHPSLFAKLFTSLLPTELAGEVILRFNPTTEMFVFDMAAGYQVSLGPRLLNMLGFHMSQLPLEGPLASAISSPNLTEGCNVLSIVSHNICPPVAGEGCFTMRHLPLPPDPDGRQMYSSWHFEKPLFLPMFGSRISSMQFAVVDEHGSALSFANWPPSPCSLSLSFHRYPFML